MPSDQVVAHLLQMWQWCVSGGLGLLHSLQKRKAPGVST